MRVARRVTLLSVVCFLFVRAETLLVGVAAFSAVQTKPTATQKVAHEAEIAARFAPVFYQALGDTPRSDYITNFDFDGDWRGDNNWDHADKKEFSLKAYIYYAISETGSHFFIHYAVFHPRDYKGGERKGALLSELMRKGADHGGKYDPTGLAEEAALAHENDMEGCLIVVAKKGNHLDSDHVVFVETLHHNNFSRYLPGETLKDFSPVRLEDQHALLYVEPKGHGIEAYVGDQKQTGKKDFLRYKFSGHAEDPSAGETKVPICQDLADNPCAESVGYELIPISGTLWPKAHEENNATYGENCDYGQISLFLTSSGGRRSEKKIKVGRIGCAFLGKVGGHNMARPPWGWFDKDERDEPLGRWFFDPATTIKRDFHLDDSFSTSYLRLPFWAGMP